MQTLGTTEESGTPPKAMIAAAQHYGFEVKSGTQWSLNQVKQFVDAGHAGHRSPAGLGGALHDPR